MAEVHRQRLDSAISQPAGPQTQARQHLSRQHPCIGGRIPTVVDRQPVSSGVPIDGHVASYAVDSPPNTCRHAANDERIVARPGVDERPAARGLYHERVRTTVAIDGRVRHRTRARNRERIIAGAEVHPQILDPRVADTAGSHAQPGNSRCRHLAAAGHEVSAVIDPHNVTTIVVAINGQSPGNAIHPAITPHGDPV